MDDIMYWIKLNNCEEIKRTAGEDVNGEPIQQHVNLLFQKMMMMMMMINH